MRGLRRYGLICVMQYGGKASIGAWLRCLLIIGLAGFHVACSGPKLLYQPLTKVVYLPHLVKGLPDHFPPHRILVPLPLDNRHHLVVTEGEVPAVVRGSEIVRAWLPARTPAAGAILSDTLYPVVGFFGTNSRGNFFAQPPSHFSPPDLPRHLFYMDDLKATVQQALTKQLQEVGLQATAVPFAYPYGQLAEAAIEADYVLGCLIEEFSLLNLSYYVQPQGHQYFVPALGPAWAQVALTLTLYRWPSGERLWEGKAAGNLTDPLPGDDTHLYGSEEEVMSVALSRAVGSLLMTPAVQDILIRQ